MNHKAAQRAALGTLRNPRSPKFTKSALTRPVNKTHTSVRVQSEHLCGDTSVACEQSGTVLLRE